MGSPLMVVVLGCEVAVHGGGCVCVCVLNPVIADVLLFLFSSFTFLAFPDRFLLQEHFSS